MRRTSLGLHVNAYYGLATYPAIEILLVVRDVLPNAGVITVGEHDTGLRALSLGVTGVDQVIVDDPCETVVGVRVAESAVRACHDGLHWLRVDLGDGDALPRNEQSAVALVAALAARLHVLDERSVLIRGQDPDFGCRVPLAASRADPLARAVGVADSVGVRRRHENTIRTKIKRRKGRPV